ncbi:MAG TPA: DinB family protein [Candidatus Limnocylindria bacterium]
MWPGKGPADLRNAFFYLMWLEQDALVTTPTPTNDAARVLTIAQAAFGDLRGLLVAVPDALVDTAPAPQEWSVRQTMEHAIRVERSYRANCVYAVTRSDDQPVAMPAELRPQADPADTTGDALAIALAFARRRMETDDALAQLDASALDRPTRYGPVDVAFDVDLRFRLHRFAVHIAEHAQQIDTTLRALGQRETDAQAYVRRLSVLRARHERRSPRDVLARLDAAAAEVASAAH